MAPPLQGLPLFLRAFSADFGRPACHGGAAPLTGHFEETSGVFERVAGRPRAFYKHAETATQIQWDRMNAGNTSCVPVYLIDYPSDGYGGVFRTVMQNFSVVTLSDYNVWAGKAELSADDKNQPPSFETPPPEYAGLQAQRRSFIDDAGVGSDFWETRSDTVIVRATGNDGGDPYELKRMVFHPAYRSGGLIAVGAMGRYGRAEDYSTPGADAVWYTGFQQGFASRAYATAAEIGAYGRRFNQQITDKPDARAGRWQRDEEGTSFISPDAGAFVGRERLRFSSLRKEDVAAAFFLAAVPVARDAGRYVMNARGLPFDDDRLGHGVLSPARFDAAMRAAAAFQAAGARSAIMRLAGDAVAADNRAAVAIGGAQTVEHVMGTLAFDWRHGRDRTIPMRHFPEHLTLVSPSGSRYRVHLMLANDNDHDNGVLVSFRSSAWLGESATGSWTIEAPAGYRLRRATLETVGATPGGTALLDRMIDRAKTESAQTTLSIPKIDPTPWDHAPWQRHALGRHARL